MKCARPDCKNEVAVSKGTKPAKYCASKACRRARVREWKAKNLPQKPPKPFTCPGCGKKITPTDGKERKYCNKPKCRRARRYANNAKWRRKHGMKPREKKPVISRRSMKKAEVVVKKKRVRRTPDTSADAGAKLRNFDRGTRAGFRAYMAENPIYFTSIFPKQTIAQAWRGVGK